MLIRCSVAHSHNLGELVERSCAFVLFSARCSAMDRISQKVRTWIHSVVLQVLRIDLQLMSLEVIHKKSGVLQIIGSMAQARGERGKDRRRLD